MVSNSEAARLQKELAHARTVAMANGVGAKSRLQALQIAYGHGLFLPRPITHIVCRYQEQIEFVERLKEDCVRNILKSSSDMAAFQQEVSDHLGALRQFAEEN